MYKPRREAIIAGAVFYDTGKPCKRGHEAPRYAVSGICRECQRGANLLQAAKVKEEVAEGRARLKARWEGAQDRGGPFSAEEAVSCGVGWYVTTAMRCGHNVVKLDGVTCQICGQADDKRALDLAEKLLG